MKHTITVILLLFMSAMGMAQNIQTRDIQVGSQNFIIEFDGIKYQRFKHIGLEVRYDEYDLKTIRYYAKKDLKTVEDYDWVVGSLENYRRHDKPTGKNKIEADDTIVQLIAQRDELKRKKKRKSVRKGKSKKIYNVLEKQKQKIRKMNGNRYAANTL